MSNMPIVPSGEVATNVATSSSFTGASLYTAGTKLDLCLKKQLFIYEVGYYLPSVLRPSFNL